jgi:Fibronectin type III domain
MGARFKTSHTESALRGWRTIGVSLSIAAIVGAGVGSAVAQSAVESASASRLLSSTKSHSPELNPVAGDQYLQDQRGTMSPVAAANDYRTAVAKAATLAGPKPAAAANVTFSDQAWSPLGPEPAATSYYGTKNSGRVRGLAVVSGLTDKVVLGSAGGGVWTATVSSATPTWATHTDTQPDLAIGAVAVNPTHPTSVFAGTGEDSSCIDCYPGLGILESANGGTSWTVSDPGTVFNGARVATIVVERGATTPANATILAATTSGLFVSADGGSTWSKESGTGWVTGSVTGLAVNTTTSHPVIYAAVSGVGIEKGNTNGAHWSTLSTGASTLPTVTATTVALGIGPTSSTSTTVVYASFGRTSGGYGGMWKSTNGGSSWTHLTAVPDFTTPSYAYTGTLNGKTTGDQGWYDNVVAVDPTNHTVAVAAGIAVVGTKNGGSTWFNLNGGSYFSGAKNRIHPDFHALTFDSAGNLYLGNDGGVWKLSTAGVTNPTKATTATFATEFSNLNDSSLDITQFYANLAQNATGASILGGAQDNGTSYYTGSGAWKNVIAGDGGDNLINPSDPTEQFGEADQALYATNNAWTSSTGLANHTTPAVNWVPPLALAKNVSRPDEPTVFYGEGSALLRIGTPFGTPTMNRLAVGSTTLSALADTSTNPTLLYLGFNNGAIYYTTNALAVAPTFTQIPGTGTGTFSEWVTHIAIDPSTGGQILTSASTSMVQMALNVPALVAKVTGADTGTPTLTNESGNLPSASSNSILYDGGDFLVATDVGVFATSTLNGSGTAWAKIGTGLPNVQVIGLTLTTNGSVLAATHGRGVWKLPAATQGTVYVSDCEANAIDVFPPGSTGNVAPERSIQGPDTGLSNPCDVQVNSTGDVFAANLGNGSITEYAPLASGDAAPICTISGTNTGITASGIDDFSLEADGTLVVATYLNGSILVFAPHSCGNVAPVEEIGGSNTGFQSIVDGVGTDAHGTIYAANSTGLAIDAFPPGANGNVAPEYTIAGSNTGLTGPDDVVVGFSGELYVSNGFGFGTGQTALTVYAPGATGNATPTQNITGSNTGFAGGIDDLSVDTSGNIYVTDAGGADVKIFAAGATGNVAPMAVIGGPNTGFLEPEGVAIAGPPGPPVGASVTTSVTASSVHIGQPTSATATINDGTNGTSPTGSLVFKLFGPNNPTCNLAPAFTSTYVPVTGAGKYSSPPYVVTSAGTYSWQVLYSGDSNNAPITTPCGASGGTVTVTPTATAPSAPTNLHETTKTHTSISLAWTVPVTGGSPITHYLVFKTGSLVTTLGPSILTDTVSGLSPATTYHFTVKAENGVGTSPPSNTLTAFTTATYPTAPTNLHETTKTHTSVSLAWTAPSSTGGSPITSYLVYKTGSLVASLGSTARSHTVTGLSGGTHYVFTVKALNTVGASPASNTVGVTTTTSSPSAPSGLRVSTKSKTSVSLAWTVPATGGSPITHYLVFKTGSLVATLGASTRSDTVTGLSPGTTYHFTVSAENVLGASPTSGTVAVTTTATTPPPPPPPPAPTSSGYDLVGSDGGVFVFPTGNPGGFYGSLPGLGVHVNDIVGMVPTSNDQGYFLVGADGGVFSFGNAPFLGSLPGLGVKPAQPITGIVPTGTDGGYFLVGKDGGVYAFGNASFLGSLPGDGVHTNNVVGIAATPSGNGYWVVSATGTVYAFGAAKQLGSATGSSSPVSAIAGTPTGGGYWIVTQNGSVNGFGNANYFGSLPGIGVSPAKPVIGVVHTSGTGGYWLIGSDGGIFAFGDAGFVGSLPGLGVNVTDIVGAVPTGG